MLKFRCGDCGQKMGVPEKFAGRGVKCTKCGVGVKVPELEPIDEPDLDASELVPMESADEGFDDYDLDNSLDDADDMLAQLGAPAEGEGLDALAELGGDPAAPPVSAPQAAAPVEGNANCGKCGAPVGAEAVICVQCGNNLKLGVNVKTIAKAKATAGFASKTLIAIIGGAVIACAAGGIWGGIVIVTHYEIGYVAWGIGILVGISVAFLAQKQDAVVGFAAACLALLGLIVGKAIILNYIMSPGYIIKEMEIDFQDNGTFESYYMDHMYEEKLFEPDLQRRWDEYMQHDDYDEALEAEAAQVVSTKAAKLSDTEREALAGQFEDDFVEDVAELRGVLFGDASFATMLKETITPWDALWFLLAVTSAWRIGNGGFGDD